VLTPFARAIETLKPGATGSDIAALLDHKVSRHCALNWKAGRHPPPAWALALLAQKVRAQASHRFAIAHDLDQMKTGPGRKAETRNIMAYNAKR